MSQFHMQEEIRSNLKFAKMLNKRMRFAIILSLVVLISYYTVMFLVFTQPWFFTAKIGEGNVIIIGWLIAALIVFGGWLLSSGYVSYANGESDCIARGSLQMKRSLSALIAGSLLAVSFIAFAGQGRVCNLKTRYWELITGCRSNIFKNGSMLDRLRWELN